jgi:hypothetical protein
MLTLDFFVAEINALAFSRGDVGVHYTEDQVRILWQDGFSPATALRIIQRGSRDERTVFVC